MKLSHCHVEITATTAGADLGLCQLSVMKCLVKKFHHSCLIGSSIRLCIVINEKLTIENKQIAHIMSGANTLMLSK